MKKLLCPKCQIPIDEHENGCPKRLTHRFFLGALGSVIGAAMVAKALPNFEVAPAEEGALLVTAAPKVHEGAYIVLDGNMEGWWTRQSDKGRRETFEEIANRTGRGVIAKIKGEVVEVVEPMVGQELKNVPKVHRAWLRS